MIATNQNESEDRKNSESDGSEEFKRFEALARKVFTLPKEEVERIRNEVPRKRRASSGSSTE